MSQFGTDSIPVKVAIVGSGPSGFYSAEALLKSDIAVKVDVIERLPTPYGLVRSGVAPDHPKLKQSILVFDKIAQMDGFNFIGNVTVGQDITVDELRENYHAVVLTNGAETDNKLNIPGSDLPGSYTATEFVGWYNGHPAYRDREFDLSHEAAVIVGQGNVAADVARILSKTVDELKTTDISEHALETLSKSKIKKIYVVGRRGPAQAKFAAKELREFGELSNCQAIVDRASLQLNTSSQQELEDKTNAGSKKVYDMFEKFAEQEDADKPRQCHFEFLQSPIELRGDGKVEQIVIERNQLNGEPFTQSARGTGETFTLDAGLMFRSIGYRGIAMPGVPFDEKRGVYPNIDGRITETSGEIVPQLYTAGWIKRGPSGIIGTNRACAVDTVALLLEDVPTLESGDKAGTDALIEILNSRNVRYISYTDWQKIDQAEIARGESKGKPREKFTRLEEMLAVLG